MPPGAKKTPENGHDFVDWDWLDARPAVEETDYLRHVRIEEGLAARLDGRSGVGVIMVQAKE